jgi:TRAP-type C4-dicarboxylate transport system substrate-binding protein
MIEGDPMVTPSSTRSNRILQGSALAATCALALTACAGSGGSPDAAGTSNGSGFADMSPVTLVVQSPYGPDHFMSEMWVDYAEVIEERSEGKITFDISYSSALSSVAEQDAGLRDGLLDMAWSMPAYNPTALPINALITEVAFLTEQTPLVSQLQGHGSTQFGMENETLNQELSDAGLVSLLTMVGQMPNNVMICTDSPVQSLADFAGKRIRVPGAGWATEVEALGATPVNIVQAEVYEALERGVIDCAVQSPANSLQLGMLDIADYYSIDTEVNFQGWNGTHITMSERVWNELPLEARQLLWDEAGNTLLRSMLVGGMDAWAEEIRTASETLEVVGYDDDVREALRAQRENTLADVEERADELAGEGNDLIASYQAVQADWRNIVGEIGYSDDAHPTWIDWAEAYDASPTNVDAFIDAYMERVQIPNRPQ